MTWKDLRREIEAHVEEKALELIESGVPEREAWERARREFGNPTLAVESSREVWRWVRWEQFFQDLRYAGRTLRRNTAFSAVAVLTLALGIGAATAVYSIVDAVLLRPLPYKDPNRLVAIWGHGTRDPEISKIFLNYADFDEFRRKSTTVESVSAATWAGPFASQVLSGSGAARQLTVIPVSTSFFDLLGANAAHGRTFLLDDEKAGCAVVLAHSLWVNGFGAGAATVGRSITLDQKPCSVVGIMPERFAFYPSRAQAWILMQPGQPLQKGVGIFARLKPGVTREQAQVETARLHAALHPSGTWSEIEPRVYDLHGEFTFLASRTLRTTLLVAFGAVGLLLLIACLNVGNLLVARMAERQREMAVRAALGSGQGRLARQVLTESLLLAVLGAVPGVGLAAAAVQYFQAASPIELTAGADLSLNGRVLGFAIALAVTTALGFGFGPSLTAARANLVDRLKAGARGTVGGRWARLSIAAQVGMSFALLILASQLMQSALGMRSEYLGFDPAGRLTTRFTLPQSRYSGSVQRLAFYERLTNAVSQLPGVEQVAFASKVPPNVGGNQQIEIEGDAVDLSARPHDVGADSVSPGFFSTLGVPLLQGRQFDSRDRRGSDPVTIVNQAFVAGYFPSSNPVGRRIRLADLQANRTPWLTIVGVVGNLKRNELMNEMRWTESPILYTPVEQEPRAGMNVVIHARAPIAAAFRQAIASLDPEVPFGDLEPIEAQIAGLLTYPRFRAMVLGFFALSALLLSAVGLHGVLTWMLGKRTAEFGLRRAVGAPTRHIVELVLRQAGLPILGGFCGGLALTFGLSRLISSLLYGSGPPNPTALAGAGFVLLATAALAILRPAMRAIRIDPVDALRQE